MIYYQLHFGCFPYVIKGSNLFLLVSFWNIIFTGYLWYYTVPVKIIDTDRRIILKFSGKKRNSANYWNFLHG